jgi:hypothetical protein
MYVYIYIYIYIYSLLFPYVVIVFLLFCVAGILGGFRYRELLFLVEFFA